MNVSTRLVKCGRMETWASPDLALCAHVLPEEGNGSGRGGTATAIGGNEECAGGEISFRPELDVREMLNPIVLRTHAAATTMAIH